MEPANDIAQALCTHFSRTFGETVFISELQKGYDNAYVVIPSGGPDARVWNGGKQIENYQQFDIYSFHKNIKTCYQMSYDARNFLSCLSCLTQAIPNPDYLIRGVRTIGGVVEIGKTAEKKHMSRFTIQITYLATC